MNIEFMIYTWTESGSDWGSCPSCGKHYTNCNCDNT